METGTRNLLIGGVVVAGLVYFVSKAHAAPTLGPVSAPTVTPQGEAVYDGPSTKSILKYLQGVQVASGAPNYKPASSGSTVNIGLSPAVRTTVGGPQDILTHLSALTAAGYEVLIKAPTASDPHWYVLAAQFDPSTYGQLTSQGYVGLLNPGQDVASAMV